MRSYSFTMKDGTIVRYKKLRGMQLVLRGQVPPAVMTEVERVKNGEVTGESFMQSGNLAAFYDAVIGAAVFDPPVWSGSAAECPETHWMPQDFEDDYMALGAAIIGSSGINEDTQRVLSFPGGASELRGPNPGPGAPHREEPQNGAAAVAWGPGARSRLGADRAGGTSTAVQ